LEGRNSNAEHINRKWGGGGGGASGHKKGEKKIKMVQMIQNMVLGSIKFESVSLFTIVLSDVKL
jgi:hypothetical protein